MLSEWFWSVLSSAGAAAILLVALGWLLRKWIGTRLTESLRLETEQKLHEFKTRLDAAEARVTSVQQAGIDATLQLSAAVVAERVSAIKRIWNGVVDWRAATAVSTIVSAIDREWVERNAEKEGTKTSFGKFLNSLNYMDLLKAMHELEKCRPFVTERAWALFKVYHGFYLSRILRVFALSIGDKQLALRFWETDMELRLVRVAAPPELGDEYAANSIAASSKFLSYIEEQLLIELRLSLAGHQSGPEASRQAANIVAAADSLLQEAEKAKVEATQRADTQLSPSAIAKQ
jgi:hypothetical protein